MCSMVSAPALSAMRCAGVREAVHGRGLVEGVRLVDDRVELFLRHVADVGLFLVGAAAAGGAGLDHVAAGQQVGAGEFAQLPRPIGGLEAEANGIARGWIRSRCEPVMVVKPATACAGLPGCRHRSHRARRTASVHEQAARAVHAEIAQRGEAHVEAVLRVEERVHLLQVRA